MADHIEIKENLVRAFGLVFNNMSLYSAEHSVTRQGIDNCFEAMSNALAEMSTITFIVQEDSLMVNSDLVELRNPLMKGFVSHLIDRQIMNFTLEQGMSKQAFENLIEVICAQPDELEELGGFVAAVTACNLENIRAVKVSFQQITENELVVSRDDFDASKDEAQSAGIVAFLNGDVSSDDPDAIENIKEAAGDSDKLSDLILHAAEIQKETADIEGGENLAGLVVGCLRRVYEGLSGDPTSESQKGKKSLIKSLVLLEEDLLEKMKNMSDGFTDGDVGMIEENVEEMVDELTIENLAAEYMKKRMAIDKNEERILRYIEKKGSDLVNESPLQDKLMDGGLTLDGWRELLSKGGLGLGDGGGIQAIGHLAALLGQMEQGGEGAKKSGEEAEDADEVAGVLSQVDGEIKKLVTKTERKIHDLIMNIREDEEAEKDEGQGKPKKEPKLTRKQLLVVLAEIVQELCQPLSVINCSVNMILSKNLGDISNGQHDMLQLASDSGEKMQTLTDKLMEIAGVPDGMSPDTDIQSSLYE